MDNDIIVVVNTLIVAKITNGDEDIQSYNEQQQQLFKKVSLPQVKNRTLSTTPALRLLNLYVMMIESSVVDDSQPFYLVN